MKRFLFAIPLMVILFSCQSKEERVEKMICNKMFNGMDKDFDYKLISIDIKPNELSYKNDKELNRLVKGYILMKKRSSPNHYGIGGYQILPGADMVRSLNKDAADSLAKKIKIRHADIVKKTDGWVVKHSCESKLVKGMPIISSTYIFNEKLDSITDVIYDEEEYLRDQHETIVILKSLGLKYE